MIASRPALMTADEFAKRPEAPGGWKEELVRGEIVMTPPPGFAHGFYQVKISAILHNYVQRKKLGRVVVETGVVTERDPDTVRGPDVSYWSKESLPLDELPRGYPNTPADLCVEVLSPKDRPAKVRRKVLEYFARGVRLVWVVDPKTKSVVVHRSVNDRETIDINGVLEGGDIVRGFRCSVAEVFE